MISERLLPDEESRLLLETARDFAESELRARVEQAEETGQFPRDVFRQMGELGFLGMPYPEELGGGGIPYEVYLQVLELLAAEWASVAVGLSVHVMSCYPLVRFGTDEQRQRWLGEMLGGDLLGAYSLSEAEAGSDAAALKARARYEMSGEGGAYRLSGSKAWVTHGGEADFYTVFLRTDEPVEGISCFLVPADTPGLSAGSPERKMGLTGSTTAGLDFDDARVDAARLIGPPGQGLKMALEALDSGRLGIAAVAVGVAQAALNDALRYAKERRAFGKPIIDHQGLAFMVADMAAGIESARSITLEAARRKDRGLGFSRQAAIAKLLATDTAMKVTTDAVQILGGYGYTKDFPVERLMREAKVMQIFEGTNQIQRMVIARDLARRLD